MRFPASAVLDFAEADGYEPLLALDTANRDGTYNFYCRIGNLDGKRRVAVPSFGHADAGQEVVLAYLEIRLDLDGPRNVETGR